MNVFGFFQSPPKFYVRIGTQRRCAIWRMSNAQALIFIAVVPVMVALALLA